MFEERLGGDLYIKAREIYKEVVTLLPLEPWEHYSQCRRSAGSVVANIAEGNGRRNEKGAYYRQFLLMARGSAYETLAWIQLGIIDGKLPVEAEERVGIALMSLSEHLLTEILKDQ